MDAVKFFAKHPSLFLWLLGAGISIGLSTLFAVELRSQYLITVSSAERTSQSFADVLAEHTSRTFEAVDRTLRVAESLRSDVLAGRISDAAANQALRSLQASSPALLAIGWTDREGNVVAHSYNGAATRQTIADLRHFTVQRDGENEGMFIAPLYKSRASQKWISAASRRLNNADGSFAGVVTAPLDLSYFATIYQSIKLGSGDAVTLIRRDGTILMREPFVESVVGQSFEKEKLFSEYLPRSSFGAYETVSPIDGKSRIYGYRAVAGLPLVMLVLQDRADVLAQWHEHVVTFGPIVALLVGIVLGGTAVLANRTKQLVRQSTLLSATLENMHQGLLVVDHTDRIAVYNRRASELLDLPESFLAKRPLSKEVIAYQTERGEFASAPDSVKARIQPRVIGETANVYIRERPNGTALEIRTVPFASGGVVRTYKDVTEAKQFERELSEREQRFRLLAENASDMIVRVGLDAGIRYMSPAGEAIIGYSADEMLGKKITDYIFPDDLDATIRHFARIIKHDPPGSRRIEYRFRRKDGGWLWFESNPKILRSSLGVAAEIFDVIRDVTERKEFEAQIEYAKQQAESAALAQAQFLAAMSHELRTPLNSIIGFSDMLLDRSELPQDARRQIGLIQTASETLLTVVNDVLDFSKIEEGKLELTPVAFDFREMIGSVVAIMQGAADAKQLDFRISVDEAVRPWLIGDHQRIRQVLFNLLNNAIKFTPGGSVSFDVIRKGGDERGDRLFISVTDTGIGIPQANLNRLFQRFSQVDGSTSREYGGSGLGLAICKRLVEMMGGQIGVTSEQGVGSTFWVDLYLAEATEGHSAARPAPAETVVTKARLLLVEDIDINREIASVILRKLGYAVDAVADGFDAIVAVKSGVYDLVLMDIQMPGMDGITATNQIRALPNELAGIPIVAMTANVLPAQVEAFRLAGMDGHIGKPFRQDELRCEIERCLVSSTFVSPLPDVKIVSPSIVDEDALALLTGLLGPGKIESLLQKLQDRLQSFVAVGGTSAASDDLAGQAHQIVSSAGMLGFKDVSRECARLEGALRDGDVSGVVLDQVLRTCKAAIIEISTRLATQTMRLKSRG